MASHQNRDRAVSLVDGMDNLPDEKRRMLRKYVSEAACGDDVALTHVILFPYNQQDYSIASKILRLILRD